MMEENNKNFHLPRIGMRIIKSSIAVGLCLLVSYILGIEKPPLAATISSLLCMQQQISTSMKISFNRAFGNFVGAFLGLITLYILWFFNINDKAIYYSIVTLLVVPVIYTSLLLKQPETGAMSAIAFLCVVISDSSLTTTPFNDAVRRALETALGVCISLTVNRFELPRRYEKDFLFIAKFDQVLYKKRSGMTPYSLFELKTLLYKGVPFTVVTGRTPAFLEEHLKDAKFKLPVIAMDGAVLYDMTTQSHIIYHSIDRDLVNIIIEELDEIDVNYYVNTVFQDVLFTHHKDFKNSEEESLYEINKKSPHRHYVNDKSEIMGDVINIALIISEKDCEKVKTTINNIDNEQQLHIIEDNLDLSDGYYHLKIYNKSAKNQSMVQHLLERTSQNKTIVIAGDKNDIALMQSADYNYVVEDCPKEIKEFSNGTIKCNEVNMGDRVLKLIYSLARPLKVSKLPKDIELLKK